MAKKYLAAGYAHQERQPAAKRERLKVSADARRLPT